MVATYNFGSVYMLIKFTNHRLKTVNHNNLTNQVAMTYGNTIFILMNYPIHIDTISMELSFCIERGCQSKLLQNSVFL